MAYNKRLIDENQCKVFFLIYRIRIDLIHTVIVFAYFIEEIKLIFVFLPFLILNMSNISFPWFCFR